MDATALTPKQEKFAQAVASGKSYADAYREAYDAGKMKPAAVQVKASALMANGKVRDRVGHLRESAAQTAGLTLENHLAELKAIRDGAVEDRKWAAAAQAEVARGKAAGLYVERTELTGRNGAPLAVVAAQLAPEQRDQLISRALEEF